MNLGSKLFSCVPVCCLGAYLKCTHQLVSVAPSQSDGCDSSSPAWTGGGTDHTICRKGWGAVNTELRPVGVVPSVGGLLVSSLAVGDGAAEVLAA